MLLSTAYLPPVEWFALVAREMKIVTQRDSGPGCVSSSPVWLEACENYQKQSWRNRFRFAAAEGPESLSIPVVHDGRGEGIPIREVKIDWSVGWPVRHQRAIASAYSSSPYFEFYRDGLFAAMDSRPDFLFDYNLLIIRYLVGKLGLVADIRLTGEYTIPGVPGPYGEDFREAIHPKRGNAVLRSMDLEKPYYQVFARKYGFTKNLSVLDLLFNEGPDSIFWLYKV